MFLAAKMSLTTVGRFAPSPSGPLHFGSLVATLGSYLMARQNNGHWLVRIEDLDPPREVPGAATEILKTLESFGFEWDGKIVYQSQRTQLYQTALDYLQASKLTYNCDCSRKILAERNHGIYDGYCRQRNLTDKKKQAVRVKFDDRFSVFRDQLLGECRFDTDENIQDFIIRRRDGLFAYQLAVVVDDIAQGVSQVVRGADIIDSTPRQNFLYACLGKSLPDYFHLPLALDATGQKLSKSRFSPAIRPEQATHWLAKAFNHLGQSSGEEIENLSPCEFLLYAVKSFRIENIGKVPIRYSTGDLGQ